MPEELGRIERPTVDTFAGGRKLFFVPLIFAPPQPPAELAHLISRYWAQTDTHLANLEAKLGAVTKVYHEMIPFGGDDGLRIVDEVSKGSSAVVKARMEKGAELMGLEDGDLLAEYMDWSRCLAMGLQSRTVVSKVFELLSDVEQRRNTHLAKSLDETLKSEDVGLLLMSEGHRVQFSRDIQVFYVAPPALDEIKRWMRDRAAELQRPGEDQEEKSE